MGLTKKVFSFFLFISLFLFTFSPVYAAGEFDVSFEVFYVVQPDGQTQVNQNIKLTNLFSSIYASSYQLLLEGLKPQDVKVQESEKSLPFEVSTENSLTAITINFPDSLVGKGKSREFSVSYTLGGVALQNGTVWEITIPKLAEADKFQKYDLSLLVPSSFGEPAYISPDPLSSTASAGTRSFNFSGNQLERAGVVAAFGEFQVFTFQLSYHLKNPYNRTAVTEIALPPDTAYQRVYYQKADPSPEAIRLDQDGNWLARYSLKAREKIDITVSGNVQIFTNPQDFYPKTRPQNLTDYLQPSEYWQVQNPEVQSLAKRLRTPEQIYNFVTTTLSYNYSRVQEGVERLGAAKALADPQSAICMEFTDLFVTLSRAAGIPAREINGFAYTDNSELQPLSLVADVLHAWPEYWDDKQGVWVPVDPTWGNTTGGVDYFSKLDLNHFTFAIHGRDPNGPLPAGSYKLGDNPQKDVNVNFGSLSANRNPSFEVNFSGFDKSFLLAYPNPVLEIKNNGPAAAYNLPVSIQASPHLRVDKSWQEIEFLGPFSSQRIQPPLSLDFLKALGKPTTLTVLVGEAKFTYTIPQEALLTSQILAVVLVLLFSTALVVFLVFGTRALRTRYEEKGFKSPKLPRRLPFQKPEG